MARANITRESVGVVAFLRSRNSGAILMMWFIGIIWALSYLATVIVVGIELWGVLSGKDVALQIAWRCASTGRKILFVSLCVSGLIPIGLVVNWVIGLGVSLWHDLKLK